MFFGQEIGIDLGTATVLVYIKGKGIVIEEPSVVAMDKNTNRLLAVGEEAQKMLGRTPGNIIALRPLRDGVISDYSMTEKMLKYFLNKVTRKSLFKPKVIICVPSGVTEVEERAVVDATIQAGASKTYLIEEPIAAAIGIGIDISKPNGTMIVDMGGGTTDIAVISLGGIVVSNSIEVAGDKFDEAVIKYVRKKYNVLIGERTAEQLKRDIGCVYPREAPLTSEVRGRSFVTGLPKTLQITSEEIMEALEETVTSVVEAIKSVLEKTPPELIGDITERGIVITGGGGLVYGMDKLFEQETGIRTYVAEDSVSCVAIGTGKALENVAVLQNYNRR